MAEPDDVGPLITAIRERRSLDEIKAIVETDPTLVRRWWDPAGALMRWLPLHEAIWMRSPPDVVRYLLEQCPESIREWTLHILEGEKNLPLHLACHRSHTTDDDDDMTTVLLLLLHAWPEAIRLRNRDGRLPVHLACSRFSDDDDMATILPLLDAWPESLRERDADGDLPVHIARSWKLMKHLVELWPESVREPGRGGEFLLHMAIGRRAPLPTVTFLVNAWQGSVRATDDNGRTPLHCICSRLSTQVTDCLLEQGGEDDLLLVADNKGYLPLHRLVKNGGDEECVQDLINRSPQSIRVKSKAGYLPLHLAIEREAPESLIRLLVGAWRQALRETTNNGYLPLHLAAETGQLERVEYLVEQWPESVEVQSVQGFLAVHLVLQNTMIERFGRDDVERNIRVLGTARNLLDRFPRSARVATNDGLLPIHVALRVGYRPRHDEVDEDDVEVEFIRYLLGLAPSSVRAASNDLLFPFNYAISDIFTSLPTIRLLAEQWLGVASHVDNEGRTPLHVVTSQSEPRPDIVRFVAELRPPLHEAQDRNGSVPLHTAVASFPPRSVLLRYSNPETLLFGFQDRFLMTLQKSMEIVGYLADQRPQSLTERDHLGNTPLHSALARDLASIDVVKQLVELRPDSTGIANRNGSLPLHVAVSNCQPKVLIDPDSSDSGYKPRPTPALDFVKLLVEQRPDSVRVKDSNGNIPLVVAAASGADPNVVLYLIKQWPEAFYGGCTMAEPAPSLRPRKRLKTTSGGP